MFDTTLSKAMRHPFFTATGRGVTAAADGCGGRHRSSTEGGDGGAEAGVSSGAADQDKIDALRCMTLSTRWQPELDV